MANPAGNDIDSANVRAVSRTPYKESREQEKRIFGRRVWRLMVAKGWSAAEFSRRTKDHDPRGKGIGRDIIGGYIRGLHLPEPPHAKILAETLGVRFEDLFVASAEVADAATAFRELPPLELRTTEGGKVMLHVNLELPMATALRVLALVQEDAGAAAP